MSPFDPDKTTANSSYLLPAVRKGRGYKQRRVSSDGKEEIWSELAHSAFMEALVVYPPMGKLRLKYHQTPPSGNCGNFDSRPLKAFGRHQLIQSFIYNKTGKMRTTQQISSHIQRLKNTHRDNPRVMALLAPTSVSMPRPGAPEASDRFDLETSFVASNGDGFSFLDSDSALKNAQGGLPFHGPQYGFLPGFAGLPLCHGEPSSTHENIDPKLQEDIFGTSSNKLHFFVEVQDVRTTRISSYSPLDSITPSNAEYIPLMFRRHLEFDTPSLQCQAQIIPVPDQDSQATQSLPFNNYTHITPAERPLHTLPTEIFFPREEEGCMHDRQAHL